jgi:uncharacterized protein (DUF1778 family)
MPRLAVEDNSRMSLRIPAEEKAILLRAAALRRTDLTDFVRQHSLNAAKAVIQDAEHLELSGNTRLTVLPLVWSRASAPEAPSRPRQGVSGRDSLRVLAALENPPKPNAKLLAAAKSLPKRK